jgi:hypothetical protein
MELGPSYVFDLLNDAVPIDTIHAFAPAKAAQQVSLALSPKQYIAVIEIVRHRLNITPLAGKLPAR